MDKRRFEAGYDRRRKIVGVMGGKRDLPELSWPLGELIARRGYHLLTGAGQGIMEGVSRAFFEYKGRPGSVIGIVRAATPCAGTMRGSRREYLPNHVNPWVEIPIYTQLHLSSEDCLSRNHINVLTSDVVIALPGNEGTASEVDLALQYGVPLIIYTGAGKIGGRDAGELAGRYAEEVVQVASTIDDVDRAMAEIMGPQL
jgi:predicted Rossmann-fold nucleotide-binding protein